MFDSALIHNDRLATNKNKDVTGGGVTQTNLENIVNNLEKSIINNNQQRSDQFDYNALQQEKGLVGDKDSFDLVGHGSTGALKQVISIFFTNHFFYSGIFKQRIKDFFIFILIRNPNV